MEEILNFFNHPFFVIVGGISTAIAVVIFFYGIYSVFRGIVPVWIRLGKSLHNRKIAIYAENDFESLKNLLSDSGIFKTKNITQITKGSIAKGAKFTMMLVYYPEFNDDIKSILKYKRDSDSLIVYAPQSEGRIEQKIMDKINKNRNSIVVNFRGRLLNDIVTSMITTTYEKK